MSTGIDQAQAAATMNRLTDELNALCEAVPIETQWYVKDLVTGQSAGRDAHMVIPSASTRKIAVLMCALSAVNNGEYSLDDPFLIEEQYQGHTSGCLQHFRPGLSITFYDALVMMIIMSDNTCADKLVDMLGLERMNDFSRQAGMIGTTHRERPQPESLPYDHPVDASNTTTAADVGVLLERIVDGMTDSAAAEQLGCTTEQCRMAIEIMTWQKLTAALPALLPKEAVVANKTGTGRRNANDAGVILKGDEPRYVLTVYTDDTPREQNDGPKGQTAAKAHIARLCRACWDALVDS
jgi:beta-lactamase class A